MAVVSVNRGHLRHLVEKGVKSAKMLDRALARPEWFLGTTLLGTNLSTITLNVVATLFVVRRFGEEYEFYTLLITAPLILIFGEVLPKVIYQRFADVLAVKLIFPLRVIGWFFAPVVFILSRVSSFFSGLTSKEKSPVFTREELQLMFSVKTNRSKMKELEQQMIDRIFSFSDRMAKDVMIPLVNVVSIRDDASVRHATVVMRRSGFSRIPVYGDRVFDIVGWVSQADLLFEKDKTKRVAQIMRKVRFVPETMMMDRLLLSMQRRGDSLAVVVDEYGGGIGLITMEDILEEVVGEVEDEFDQDEKMIERLSSHHLKVNARVSILEINEKLPTKIPEGEYETLGGFLQMKLQRMPQEGDSVLIGGSQIRVIDATERSVECCEIFLSRKFARE